MSWFSSAVNDDLRPGPTARVNLRAVGAVDPATDHQPVAVRSKSTTGDLRTVRPAPTGPATTGQAARRAVRRPAGLSVALTAADVVALVLTGLVAQAVVGGGIGTAVVFGLLTLACRTAARQYRRRLSLSVLDDLPRLLGATLAAVGLSAIALAVAGDSTPDIVSLIERAAWFVLFATAAESVVMTVARRVRRRRPGRRTLVIGGSRVGGLLVEALREHPDLGLDPIGVVDPEAATLLADHSAVIETDVDRLVDAVAVNRIDTAIVALRDGESHVDTVMAMHRAGCETLLVPSVFEMQHDGPDVDRVRGVPLIRLRPDPTTRPSWWVKRGVDIVVAGLGLLLLAPVLSVVALLVVLDSGRPVMFWQERVGVDGSIFRLCKFRSMRPESEHESQTTWNIAADPRVSRIGHVLRRTSIDEIPQLWNILRGQMSLVGPRPERPTFVQQFTVEHERYWARHRVPVGLTGLAQVNGLRGDTSIRDRARYDNYYIANWSLWLDLKVVLLTVREVLGGRGR